MKKIVLLLFVSAFIKVQVQAQICGTGLSLQGAVVSISNSPADTDLDYVVVNPYNANEAWAVGKQSLLIKMTRSGNTWSAAQQTTTFTQYANQRFKYIQFLSPTTYLLAGDGIGNALSDSGNVYISTNSGTTWVNQPFKVPGGPNYYIIRHPSFSNWYITGTRNGVFITKNSGLTWVRQTNITPSNNFSSRYYSAVLDTATGTVLMSNRDGYIRRTVIANFTTAGNDNPTWTNVIAPTTTLGSITIGNASWDNMFRNGNTIWAVSDNDAGAALIRSNDNGLTWGAITVQGYSPLLHGQFRWVSANSNVVGVVDNVGYFYYATNASSAAPTFTQVVGNFPSDTTGTYTLNTIAISTTPDVQILVAGNKKQFPTIGSGPILNHFSCQSITGLSASVENKEVSLYPNPAQGSVNLVLNAASMVRLMDVKGRVIKSIFYNAEGNFEMDLSDIHAGVYFLSIQSAETIQTKKLLKE